MGTALKIYEKMLFYQSKKNYGNIPFYLTKQNILLKTKQPSFVFFE